MSRSNSSYLKLLSLGLLLLGSSAFADESRPLSNVKPAAAQPSSCVRETFSKVLNQAETSPNKGKRCVTPVEPSYVLAGYRQDKPVVSSVVKEVAADEEVYLSDEGTWDAVEQPSACGDSCGKCSSCGCASGCDHACCQMPQHHAYYPVMHGYYYFRPYNHAHVSQQQLIAIGWGEDPRAPYANSVFQRVYKEYKADMAEAKADEPQE